MNNPTNTGNYVALAAIIVSILAHYNIVVSQDSIVAVIVGALALYGVIHQLVMNKTGKSVAGSILGK